MIPHAPLDEMMKRVVHPCDAWAHGAKQDHWRAAVEVMKTGKLVCGPAPRMGQATLTRSHNRRDQRSNPA